MDRGAYLDSLRPVFISEEIEKQFQEHALSSYPNEAVAIVTKSGKLVILDNKHSDPTNSFSVPKSAIIAAAALLHSHPDWPAEPSAKDMASQVAMGIPWGICEVSSDSVGRVVWFGDHLLDLPLDNRYFIHGVTDCYNAIRSWNKQKLGLIIKEYPRSNAWWDNNQNLYYDNFSDAGYSKVEDSKDVKYGDVLLMCVHANVLNHAAIVDNNGLLYHHLMNRYSGTQPLIRWNKCIELRLRHESQK